MTNRQLDKIRARAALLLHDPGVVHDGGTGDLYVQDTTALLAEVERLTAERDSLLAYIKRHAEGATAFARGSEAMRQAAAAVARARADLPASLDTDKAWCRSAQCILEAIESLPMPEDR